MFEVSNKYTRSTPLGFRIFDSKRHHSIRVHSKMSVSGNVGDVVKNSYKK